MKELKQKDLDCASKLQESEAKNKEKIKSINKSNKIMVELIKTSYEKRIERVKDTGATLISKLSDAVVEQTNSNAACLQLCEKKIEENKKQHECDIAKLNCEHNTETVSLKKEIKEHEEKRDRLEWIFGRQTDNPFLKNVGNDKENTMNFLDEVSKNLAGVSPEDLRKYFLQTQSIIQQSAVLRLEAEQRTAVVTMEAEQSNKDLRRICCDQKQQLVDMKERLDKALDTILDQQKQIKETPVQFTLSKTVVANPNGKGANKKWDVGRWCF